MPRLHSDPTFSKIRSSAAEVLAKIVHDLFPQALLVGGGSTNIGFYYDFISQQPMDKQILEILETTLRTHIKENRPVQSLSMMRENAFDFLTHHGHPILAQRALQEESNVISLFQLDSFYSLSQEPHIQSTEEIGSIKLLEIVKTQRFLQEEGSIDIVRIIGTSFPDSYELKQFVKAYEKLKKYDHRLLGPELQMFQFLEKTGSINCFWLPKGKELQEQLISLWKEECQKITTQIISSPLVVPESFINKEKIRLLPSFEVQEEPYSLSFSRVKHHIQIFKYQWLNAQSLPIRLGEIAPIYQQVEEVDRWGLFKGYSYQSDLVTIFCSSEQVAQELNYCLQFIKQTIRIFDLEAHWYLLTSEYKSTKSKYKKEAANWLTHALEGNNLSYETQELGGFNEEPRIEVRLVDSLGREWVGPCVTIITEAMEDFSEAKSKPIVLTRTVFRSLDRWIGLLIERWKGIFPLWLAPEQVRILGMGGKNRSYAERIYGMCKQQGYRVDLDCRDEKLGAKIHAAEKEKIPYLVIIGDKEASQGKISVRTLQDKDKTSLLDIEEFFKRFQDDLNKSIEVNVCP